ncbi:rnf141 [Symbiodinium sp. CCMP2456]|nr:rnf141 [Symbiodinium sp. CCMP2456]
MQIDPDTHQMMLQLLQGRSSQEVLRLLKTSVEQEILVQLRILMHDLCCVLKIDLDTPANDCLAISSAAHVTDTLKEAVSKENSTGAGFEKASTCSHVLLMRWYLDDDNAINLAKLDSFTTKIAPRLAMEALRKKLEIRRQKRQGKPTDKQLKVAHALSFQGKGSGDVSAYAYRILHQVPSSVMASCGTACKAARWFADLRHIETQALTPPPWLIQSPSTSLEHRDGNIFLEGRQDWSGRSVPPEGGYSPGLTPFYLSYDRFFGPCKLDPGTLIHKHHGQSCLRTVLREIHRTLLDSPAKSSFKIVWMVGVDSDFVCSSGHLRGAVGFLA